jgi:disulfide bond formation protein DsbB
MPSDMASSNKLAGQLMLVSAIAFAIALATIMLAHVFERFGYAPCPLCLQERYAYYFGVPATVVAFFAARAESFAATRILLVLVALAFLINAGLGVYHSGIEWKWWEGPASCAGGVPVEWGDGGVASAIERAEVVSCSEASWRMLSLSFAGWNAVVSALIAGIAGYGASLRRQLAYGSSSVSQ